MAGNNTYEDIATLVDCARSTVGRYLDIFEHGGFEALLKRGKPKAPETPMREAATEGQPTVLEELKGEVLVGTFRTARHIQEWLKKKHGIEMTHWAVYYWLKELGAKLLVPRPVHRKKDPQKTAAFPAKMEEKLQEFIEPIKATGRPIRIWVQDEGRVGLHTIVRRAWGLPGHRIVKLNQRKYQWSYVYAAMEIGTGRIETLTMSNVNLESSLAFLNYLRETEPEAEHIVIWDGAGFHQKQGVHELPEHVHVIQLPPYSPEFNPTEKLWDIMKDDLCNRLFDNLEQLEAAIHVSLQPFYDQASRVIQLLGNCITVALANASSILYSPKVNYKTIT
jgi:transposase